MTKKSATNIAASVRQRLLDLAHARHEDYNALLVQYVIERFLFRQGRSELSDQHRDGRDVPPLANADPDDHRLLR